MSLNKVAVYRRMAAKCLKGAQTISDSAAKLQWLELAQNLRVLADAIEKDCARNDPGEGALDDSVLSVRLDLKTAVAD